MKPKYAIAILSYNHPEITSRCVESVLKIHSHENIFLTHNGSHPDFVSQLKNKFPQVQHLHCAVNKGYSGGVNFTLNQVFEKFERILFLTNDIELLNIHAAPDFEFASIKILKRNTTQIDSLLGEVHPSKGQLSHIKDLNQIKNNDMTYIPGTAFWISAQTFKTVGLIDESFHTYWEDVDFSFRARKAQIKLEIDHLTVCKHKIGKTCHKNRFYTYELYQRNRGFFMKKHKLINLSFIFTYIYDLFKYCRSDYKHVFKTLYQLFLYKA